MEFLHASIALLASMVLVLAGMVGWLYWQQTRIFQNMNSIVMVIGELARPPSLPEPQPEPEAQPEPEPVIINEEDEDDRVSVAAEAVTGAPESIDTDSLESKSKKELKDMLTKRGIPFGKNESKSGLISALKATA
jgi:hypothetical protein